MVHLRFHITSAIKIHQSEVWRSQWTQNCRVTRDVSKTLLLLHPCRTYGAMHVQEYIEPVQC